MAVAANAKLRILLVIESTSGGSARHVLDLAQGLIEEGHLVQVAFSSLRADKWFLDELGSIEGLRTHVIDMQRNPGPSDIGAALKLRKLIRGNGPFDIVHGHSSKAGALVRLAAVGLGCARVYTPHAFMIVKE